MYTHTHINIIHRTHRCSEGVPVYVLMYILYTYTHILYIYIYIPVYGLTYILSIQIYILCI